MGFKEKLLAVADVAFNNNVDKIKKVSFSKLIDVQFGIYNAGMYKDWLTINLKPTHGILDWVVNFIAFSRNGKHAGYAGEWNKYKSEFLQVILDNARLRYALDKGVIIAGRSKGGGEALIIADDVSDMQGDNILVGAIEPPRVCTGKYRKFIEKKIGADNIIYTIYKNDIVPSLPFWLCYAGKKFQFGKRTLGLSVDDHIKSTTEEKLIYNEISKIGTGTAD